LGFSLGFGLFLITALCVCDYLKGRFFARPKKKSAAGKSA
jgi:hypothetical protein